MWGHIEIFDMAKSSFSGHSGSLSQPAMLGAALSLSIKYSSENLTGK